VAATTATPSRSRGWGFRVRGQAIARHPPSVADDRRT
jgi:hypothetical protein